MCSWQSTSMRRWWRVPLPVQQTRWTTSPGPSCSAGGFRQWQARGSHTRRSHLPCCTVSVSFAPSKVHSGIKCVSRQSNCRYGKRLGDCRLLANPSYYDLEGTDADSLNVFLSALVEDTLADLEVRMQHSGGITAAVSCPADISLVQHIFCWCD
jgi:hypothetical protein